MDSISQEDLDRRLRVALDALDAALQSEANSARRGYVAAQYAAALIRARAVLYPRPTVLQVEKPGQDWEALSQAERLKLVEQARDRLNVIETETRALTPGRP